MRGFIDLITEAKFKQYYYLSNCTNTNYVSLMKMINSAKPVSYDTLLNAVGKSELSSVFGGYDWSNNPRDLAMKNDPNITYFKSVFEGHPCYYVRESGIEWIFISNEEIPQKTKKPKYQNIDNVFHVYFKSPKKIEVVQSAAAKKDAATKLIALIKDNGITEVNDDGDEKTAEEFVDWLYIVTT